MNSLTVTLGDQGKLDEAESVKQQVLEKRHPILSDQHSATDTEVRDRKCKGGQTIASVISKQVTCFEPFKRPELDSPWIARGQQGVVVEAKEAHPPLLAIIPSLTCRYRRSWLDRATAQELSGLASTPLLLQTTERTFSSLCPHPLCREGLQRHRGLISCLPPQAPRTTRHTRHHTHDTTVPLHVVCSVIGPSRLLSLFAAPTSRPVPGAPHLSTPLPGALWYPLSPAPGSLCHIHLVPAVTFPTPCTSRPTHCRRGPSS